MRGAWITFLVVLLDMSGAVVAGVVVGQLAFTGLTAAGWPPTMRWGAAFILGSDVTLAVLRMSSTWFKKVTGP